MIFISEPRINPQTGFEERYYRLKESFRDALGRPRNRILLHVGFLHGLSSEEIRDISIGLTYRFKNRNQQSLFEANQFRNFSEKVNRYIDKYWQEMIERNAFDVVDNVIAESNVKARGLIDVHTADHTDARDVGAEWLCLQALMQLKFDKLLEDQGWSKVKTQTALAHLIVRTVYSPSEFKSRRIMEDNSAVCELVSGNYGWLPSMRSIYETAPALFDIKDKIERHLCSMTDNLFNLTNRIVLFDLTNTYFEGRKENSTKAKFGRSKEKRNDCKLLVLALCINTEGFIRYSSILEGNTADPRSLPDMVENLISCTHTPTPESQRTLVVIDAGIATEANLELLKEKGYNYLCVSRTRLSDYELSEDARTVTVYDTRRRPISLHEIQAPHQGDCYLQITSPTKEMKEASMNRRFKESFETELERISRALTRKGGTKKYEKVIERIGRAKEKYPSIARHYEITYERNEKNAANMGSISWSIRINDDPDRFSGVYFLRTNIRTLDERTTWDYYNLIREIECTNRQLKNDLNLRPIYHRKDERSDAHIFFGLLSYWIVNTIRHQLKQKGESCYWTEIVRRMSTQKAVTTQAVNALGEKVEMRICSLPQKGAEEIYSKLNYKKIPFRKIKICSTQPPP